MNNLEIMDYKGVKRKIPINLDKLSIIDDITIAVISGDEKAIVTFIDGHFEAYDSSKTRYIHYMDAIYTIYNKHYHINRLAEFSKRKNSYDF